MSLGIKHSLFHRDARFQRSFFILGFLKENCPIYNERLIRTRHVPWNQSFQGYVRMLDPKGHF